MAPKKQMPPRMGWRLVGCEKTHGPRAGALHCLLAQAGHSLKVQENSWPRADALYCLLAQAGHSLKVQENQMPPLSGWRLVFFCTFT